MGTGKQGAGQAAARGRAAPRARSRGTGDPIAAVPWMPGGAEPLPPPPPSFPHSPFHFSASPWVGLARPALAQLS